MVLDISVLIWSWGGSGEGQPSPIQGMQSAGSVPTFMNICDKTTFIFQFALDSIILFWFLINNVPYGTHAGITAISVKI